MERDVHRRAAPLVLVTALTLTGCAATPPYEASGPWASEFEYANQQTDNTFVRDAIADGVITDQEYAETVERLRTCLKAVGITLSVSEGSLNYDIPGDDSDQAHENFNRCSAESGENYLGWLYHGIRRNPSNVNELEIIAACLVKAGLVEPGYDRDDYEKDAQEQTLPFADSEEDQAAYQECLDDPLGILD